MKDLYIYRPYCNEKWKFSNSEKLVFDLFNLVGNIIAINMFDKIPHLISQPVMLLMTKIGWT